MSDSKWLMAAAVGVVFLAQRPATAQQPYPNYQQRPGPSPIARPQLNPYLNLLRGGSPAANYYLGVVPEIDRRRNDRIFGTAIQDLERRVEQQPVPGLPEEPLPGLPPTGHASYFLNYSPYYNLSASPFGVATQPQQTPAGRGPRAR